MDLRASDEDPYQSGSENENETPAEKRLRLAQMYLEGVKTSLAEGEYDAAEIDKELISARLKQDVLEQSGKIHLFVADSVCDHNPPPCSCLLNESSMTSRHHQYLCVRVATGLL
jgi:ribosomal RNA-processing protein 9